ncbi:unnamed protein product [Auanema sp. JU1783]|nr:unnamed protein product [Auanema sp. JU1783]
MSGPNETEARTAIRETWLKLSSKGPSVFKHFFPIGVDKLSSDEISLLEQENAQFNDMILLSNLEETYQSLSKKTRATMEYAYQNHKFSYLLKIDSDSFVRIGAFVKALKDVQHPRLYWGFLDGRAKPIRKGKWKESNWMLCDRYLPYQLGGGYVLSYELVRYVAINSKLLKLYKNEDVSVGAWLAGLDVKYVHDPRFDTEWFSRGCNNEYLITHKKKPSDMRQLFQNLYNKKLLCEKEFRTRWSYVYDWAALPSECCKRLNGTMVP